MSDLMADDLNDRSQDHRGNAVLVCGPHVADRDAARRGSGMIDAVTRGVRACWRLLWIGTVKSVHRQGFGGDVEGALFVLRMETCSSIAQKRSMGDPNRV